MLYCRKCSKHVDFNSLASNQVKGALTIDNPNADIDPSIILSESKIINVCKNCGDVVKEKSEWLEIDKRNSEQQKFNNVVAPIFGACFLLLCAALLSCVYPDDEVSIGSKVALTISLLIITIIGTVVCYGAGISDD